VDGAAFHRWDRVFLEGTQVSLYHEIFAWQKEMPGLKKLVLVFMARGCNQKTREWDPTVQRISFECGMSESAVRTFLKELETDGLLSRMKVPGKGAVYRVNLGELPA
jgi:hypothetical protein